MDNTSKNSRLNLEIKSNTIENNCNNKSVKNNIINKNKNNNNNNINNKNENENVTKNDAYYRLTKPVIVLTVLKLLLIPAYRSTDFEVHRNWMAITHSLPLKEWYFSSISEWTLDYPPFFAWFEYLLSFFANLIDPAMLDINNLNYASIGTICFQRITVILSELLLVFALQKFINDTTVFLRNSANKSLKNSFLEDSLSTISSTEETLKNEQRVFAISLAIILNPGFLIIDHIHFQYNGFLFGILIYSFVYARSRNTLIYTGLLFSILLCFKHIYLYIAPAYFTYLLRVYCLKPTPISTASTFNNEKKSFFWWLNFDYLNIFKLAFSVVSVFLIAFLPFPLLDNNGFIHQFAQILKRLFPFSRGLMHAYWAPNFWAIYATTDRVSLFILKLINEKFQLNTSNPFQISNDTFSVSSSTTRGLIGDTNFTLLPDISPKLTFFLTLFVQVIGMLRLFFSPTRRIKMNNKYYITSTPSFERFIAAVAYCGFAAFLFGWHVHEKAILLPLIPLTFLSLHNRRYLEVFKPCASAACVSLVPLVFTSAESGLIWTYILAWVLMTYTGFDYLVPASKSKRIFLLDRLGAIYRIGFYPVVLCYLLIPLVPVAQKFDFLPLMLISIYCSLGILGSFIAFSWLYFFADL